MIRNSNYSEFVIESREWWKRDAGGTANGPGRAARKFGKAFFKVASKDGVGADGDFTRYQGSVHNVHDTSGLCPST